MLNIYVGNLDYGITSDDLKELFEEFGTVNSASVITDRETRRSKGFGFVEMENDEEARKAIEELDGAEFEDRPLKVNEAKPREDNRKRTIGTVRSVAVDLFLFVEYLIPAILVPGC